MAEVKKAELAASPNADLCSLVRRAESGDKSAMPALSKVLDGNRGLVEALGDLAAQVENTLIRNAAGNNLVPCPG